jgi:hypothetical protein
MLLGVLGTFFVMGPAASSSAAPDSTNPKASRGVPQSSDHPAAVVGAQCQGTRRDVRSSVVREQRVGAPELVEPLRRREFDDNRVCQRNWLGGTCFMQENSVCTIVIHKVGDDYYMDCY